MASDEEIRRMIEEIERSTGKAIADELCHEDRKTNLDFWFPVLIFREVRINS